ncbi:hypothetical protein C8R45DRAFT_1079646 [Mycena sanguinolenta]|nr:hypothetical protein C8R45DRAFT_1079646 [Mycena sanguinolenta]
MCLLAVSFHGAPTFTVSNSVPARYLVNFYTWLDRPTPRASLLDSNDQTIFRTALCPQALQVLKFSQYLGLKIFWEPLMLRMGWVVASRSMLFGTFTSVWSLLGFSGGLSAPLEFRCCMHPTGVYAPTVSSLTAIEPFVDRKEVDHKPKGRRPASGVGLG